MQVPTNMDRAEHGRHLLAFYRSLTADSQGIHDDETAIANMVADIRHFCNLQDYNFLTITIMAEVHFNSETTEEPD